MVTFYRIIYYYMVYSLAKSWSRKNATSLRVKMRWIFICVPVSTCVMAWHALVLMLENILGGTRDREVKN